MTSIIYNTDNIREAAIAAAFAVTDVEAIPYNGDAATAVSKITSITGTLYAFDDTFVDGLSTLGDVQKIIGVIPIGLMGKCNVPKDIIVFMNKHSAELTLMYIGMLDEPEYTNLMPFQAFYRLFSNVEFDVRDGGVFMKNAMIRDKHASTLAAEIPCIQHKGAIFLRYVPYVDRRVAAEKKKEDAPSSIVVYSDNTGFANDGPVVMRLIVYGNIPGCLAAGKFNDPAEDGTVTGEISLSDWANVMVGAKTI